MHPEHGPGFDLWVGGGLSTNPMIAQRLGVWVPLDEVPDVWAGVVSIFRDYGYRRLRTAPGSSSSSPTGAPRSSAQVLEDEYLDRKLIDGPAPASPDEPVDHVGVHPQKDGRYYVGFAPTVGPRRRHDAVTLADLAEGPAPAGSGSPPSRR